MVSARHLWWWKHVEVVLSQEDKAKEATSGYIDDIFVNESVASATYVKEYLSCFWSNSKYPKRQKEETKILSLEVWEMNNTAIEARKQCSDIFDAITRRNVFFLCGKLDGYFPVCGWLGVAAGFIKRRVNLARLGWRADWCSFENGVTENNWQVETERFREGRMAKKWIYGLLSRRELFCDYITRRKRSCDLGRMLVASRQWLPLYQFGRALQWQAKVLHLKTDLCMYHWLNKNLTDKTRVRTKTASEMLMKRSIYRCLSPDRTWYKVNNPKVGLKWRLGEGKVGHERRLELCWSMLVISPLSAMWAWWA